MDMSILMIQDRLLMIKMYFPRLHPTAVFAMNKKMSPRCLKISLSNRSPPAARTGGHKFWTPAVTLFMVRRWNYRWEVVPIPVDRVQSRIQTHLRSHGSLLSEKNDIRDFPILPAKSRQKWIWEQMKPLVPLLSAVMIKRNLRRAASVAAVIPFCK